MVIEMQGGETFLHRFTRLNGQYHQHRAGILCRIIAHRAVIEKTDVRFD